jgi:hypothetical protein
VSNPLPLGTVVPPYGRIGATGVLDGERYYWFAKGTDVAMMPASVIEPLARPSVPTPESPAKEPEYPWDGFGEKPREGA